MKNGPIVYSLLPVFQCVCLPVCLPLTMRLSSGYHPQSNVQTQRKTQEVGRFLWTFCNGHQNSWNQFLGWAEYVQISLRQPSTGLTPFPVCIRWPASSIPLTRWTIRCSIHRLLVPRERKSLGRRSPSTTAGSAQAQDHSRPSKIRRS